MARLNSKRLSADYELKRKNPSTLGDDSFLDSHLKPIKVDSKNSILELSDNELKVRGTIDASAITVDGASVQTGTDAGATQLSELSDVAYSSGDLTITSLDTIVAGGDLTLASEYVKFVTDEAKKYGPSSYMEIYNDYKDIFDKAMGQKSQSFDDVQTASRFYTTGNSVDVPPQNISYGEKEEVKEHVIENDNFAKPQFKDAW